ncbi:hypothetical protein H6F93_30920 [Leptolyngbya sp. FACHB-671]|uniref:hypothetical protein n=1 Tax=Leptolyngbya sp. FACHB-671 TaxID=2692812 RepID=UPI0016890F71|nr:hypothetical protein [Leptolyngbya sp. FACHB-671]MBD2071883.1 hypothetical protein [Leptolyngbya sp. FACHB-671]
MSQLLWIAIAWIGGTALILGSLMTLGSLLLFLVPAGAKPAAKGNLTSSTSPRPWQNQLKLLLLSLSLTLAGLGLLSLFPFPQGDL